METNPYQTPATSRRPLPKRPYTRFRFLVDIFALIFAILPVPFMVWNYYSNTGVVIANATYFQLWVMLIGFLVVLVMWLVSLVINAAGAFRVRPVSAVGLLLNIVSLIASFML
jgi:hypothetical protein